MGSPSPLKETSIWLRPLIFSISAWALGRPASYLGIGTIGHKAWKTLDGIPGFMGQTQATLTCTRGNLQIFAYQHLYEILGWGGYMESQKKTTAACEAHANSELRFRKVLWTSKVKFRCLVPSSGYITVCSLFPSNAWVLIVSNFILLQVTFGQKWQTIPHKLSLWQLIKWIPQLISDETLP